MFVGGQAADSIMTPLASSSYNAGIYSGIALIGGIVLGNRLNKFFLNKIFDENACSTVVPRKTAAIFLISLFAGAQAGGYLSNLTTNALHSESYTLWLKEQTTFSVPRPVSDSPFIPLAR